MVFVTEEFGICHTTLFHFGFCHFSLCFCHETKGYLSRCWLVFVTIIKHILLLFMQLQHWIFYYSYINKIKERSFFPFFRKIIISFELIIPYLLLFSFVIFFRFFFECSVFHSFFNFQLSFLLKISILCIWLFVFLVFSVTCILLIWFDFFFLFYYLLLFGFCHTFSL